MGSETGAVAVKKLLAVGEEPGGPHGADMPLGANAV